MVTHTEFHGQVSDTISRVLAPHGLTFEKNGTWLGDGSPARPMFELLEWKGAMFTPRWGVALDFVPHIAGERAVWHRTRKSARADIHVQPVSSLADIEMSMFKSSTRRPHHIESILALCLDKAVPFWERAQNPANLPDLLEDAMASSAPEQFFHYRDTMDCMIARAFIPAYLGEIDSAETAWLEIEDLARRDREEGAWFTHEKRDALRKRFYALLESKG